MKFIYKKFRTRVEEIRQEELFERMAFRLQFNYRKLMLRTGKSVGARNLKSARNSAVIYARLTNKMMYARASGIMANFLEASRWRKILANRMKAMKDFVYHWFERAKEVRSMTKTRREFLTAIFAREHRIML